ncbi:hypothetical protein C2869_04400 [Saccharobesus litoralis]|uniref:Uncharacterized protein n=1 Tax=Saccharobesus litoralis TaxID=2172099 RepID=A0A2S0VND9_9ALTE|nr:hypothetical protein [Saccharobesus litoralis]AWB65725.1 hypothetical protein C2869_04400 [Saccharobesus litoralis]
MKNFKPILMLLVLLQVLLSYLFYRFGSLFFFLEERAQVIPVRSLASQGSGEDLLISLGGILFLALSAFYLLNIKSKLRLVDLLALFIVLVLQALFLMMIEVASLSISIMQTKGWILLAWFSVYATLWLVFLVSFVNKSIGWIKPSK